MDISRDDRLAFGKAILDYPIYQAHAAVSLVGARVNVIFPSRSTFVMNPSRADLIMSPGLSFVKSDTF
jgi:hypothetical protein